MLIVFERETFRCCRCVPICTLRAQLDLWNSHSLLRYGIKERPFAFFSEILSFVKLSLVRNLRFNFRLTNASTSIYMLKQHYIIDRYHRNKFNVSHECETDLAYIHMYIIFSRGTVIYVKNEISKMMMTLTLNNSDIYLLFFHRYYNSSYKWILKLDTARLYCWLDIYEKEIFIIILVCIYVCMFVYEYVY